MNTKAKRTVDWNRQAVLLIHGIGEQRPMETLRRFAETVWSKDENLHRPHKAGAQMWSKPYSLSENFELRRLTTAENKAGLYTDFFELYWAHLMEGTKVSHVIAWARTLLLRPWRVPRHLWLAYVVLIVLIAVGVWMAYTFFSADEQLATKWWRAVASGVALPAALAILTNIVGDAARYLHVAPPNVQCRHAIRAAGVSVLKELHDHGYGRIIVVGHSLGSVIGYDILTHAWTAFNAERPADNVEFSDSALTQLEELADKVEKARVAKQDAKVSDQEIQRAQRAYFDERCRTNGLTWRVSDFVTLGSPLAHANLLLAASRSDMQRRVSDREFPSCLPTLERTRKNHRDITGFTYPAGERTRVPHHAAVFGPTQWTNLYFPCWCVIWGDIVGGPLKGIFGAGVRDVKVRTWHWLGFFSHTLYWRMGRWSKQHIAELRNAVDLLDGRHKPETSSTPVRNRAGGVEDALAKPA